MNMEKIAKAVDVAMAIFVGIALAGIFYMAFVISCRVRTSAMMERPAVTTSTNRILNWCDRCGRYAWPDALKCHYCSGPVHPAEGE